MNRTYMPGERNQTISPLPENRNTHTLSGFQDVICFFGSPPVTQSNMSNKPNKVHLWLSSTMRHRYNTHTCTERKAFLVYTHTHTYTHMVGNDRELLTASTWPDRPFTISLTVKPNVLEECVCVYECVTGANWERGEWTTSWACVCVDVRDIQYIQCSIYLCICGKRLLLPLCVTSATVFLDPSFYFIHSRVLIVAS